MAYSVLLAPIWTSLGQGEAVVFATLPNLFPPWQSRRRPQPFGERGFAPREGCLTAKLPRVSREPGIWQSPPLPPPRTTTPWSGDLPTLSTYPSFGYPP